ncbi:MAG: ABC transporter permease [Lysobacterales bacterium CG02_land_8_20_14_3_00_62_12]|nr:MAG: ABC transporter permease [Xanthomonadales bacterium CG02_land_8_20_14_3_00_62_12]PJA37802.1 MAG: ABC transporter permease [Xanthomonadales bacterium CG_4_9_14_3_um_filter_62_6]
MRPPWLTIFLKEVRENLRDRKTVMNALLIGPVIGPVLMGLLFSAMFSREAKRAEKPLELPVIGAEQAPNLIHFLRTQNIRIKPAPSNAERAVREQDEDVVLRLDARYGENWRQGDPAPLELIYDSSHQDAHSAQARVEAAIAAYSHEVEALRLLARGIHPIVAKPISVVDRDQASPEAKGAAVLMFLPYFLILGAFMGGMYLAIDTTAGERERQSLEPLLANPVPRWKIMAGKLLATAAFALASLLLTLIAFAIVMPLLPLDKLGLKFNLNALVFAQMLLVLAPVVILAASIQTAVAAHSRSFREAQSWLGILNIIPIIPSMLLMVIPVKPALWMFSVPLLAQQLSIMKLVRAEPMAATEWSALLASGLLLAGVVAFFAARIYNRESLAVSS